MLQTPKVTKNTQYISKACSTDNFQEKIAAIYAIKHNLKSAVVVFDIAHDYSIRLARAFIKSYKKRGGEISQINFIVSGEKNFNIQIEHIKNSNPSFIYIPILAKEAGLFLKQLRAAGINTQAMGGDGIADPKLLTKLAGEAANGVMYTNQFNAKKPPTTLSKEFIQDFKEKYNRLPNAFAATGADGYLMIYNAIKKCNTKSNFDLAQFKICVNNAIRNTTDLEGVTGYITIDSKTGNPINKTAVIEKVENGNTILMEFIKP